MKKLLLAALTIPLLGGCYKDPRYKDPQSTKTVGNGVKVEFLFQHEGIRMYRFNDGGHYHYFTNRGETITTQTEGKNNYEETIK